MKPRDLALMIAGIALALIVLTGLGFIVSEVFHLADAAIGYLNRH